MYCMHADKGWQGGKQVPMRRVSVFTAAVLEGAGSKGVIAPGASIQQVVDVAIATYYGALLGEDPF